MNLLKDKNVSIAFGIGINYDNSSSFNVLKHLDSGAVRIVVRYQLSDYLSLIRLRHYF